MQGELFLGIDGGASKTAGVLLDHEGYILGQCKDGASAIEGKPSKKACAVLSSIVKKLCRKANITPKEVYSCAIGLSGVDFPDEYSMQRKEIAKIIGMPPKHLVLVNDGIVALWGATPAPAAVILQHGTSYTDAFRAKHGGETTFDHLNVGRIFDLRLEIIPLIARMIDGRAKATPLKEKVLAYLGIFSDTSYREKIYRQLIPREQIKSTLPLIFDAWLAGDPAIAPLMERAIDDYILTIKTMITRTNSDTPDVIFGGGVMTKAPKKFMNILVEHIRKSYPGVTVKLPDLPPEIGAAILAAFKVGYEPVAFFHKVLKAYHKIRR